MTAQAELQRLQRWPWPRATYALVLNRLFESGAQAVGFDLLFDTPSGYGTADDQAFADGLKAHSGKVILGAQVIESRGSIAGLSFVAQSLPETSQDCSMGSSTQTDPPSAPGLLRSNFVENLGQVCQSWRCPASRKRQTDQGDLERPRLGTTVGPIWATAHNRNHSYLGSLRTAQLSTPQSLRQVAKPPGAHRPHGSNLPGPPSHPVCWN